jgi:hypothetical protein
MTAARTIVVLGSALVLAACSSGSHHASSTTVPTGTAPTTSVDQQAAQSLERSVRAALRSNDQLSGVVLWTNRVPRSASESTGGPALVSLRTAAAQRRAKHLRIRTVSTNLQIVSIKLDPSYTRATAIIRSRQVVRPYRAGTPLGRAVKLDERARVELHRLESAARFVVWRVVGLP